MLIVGLWLTTVLLALPLTAIVGLDVASQLGASARAETVANGADYDWMQELNATAHGVTATLTANVIGFAATLDNASRLVDRRTLPLPLAGALATYVIVMTILAGGAIDRLARDRKTRAVGFFASCALFAPRLIRLGLVALVVYFVLFNPYSRWLFDTWVPALTRNATQERTVFFARLAAYVALLLPLVCVATVFDYARMRLIVEDRRSVLGAIAAGLRFIFRHARGAATLFVLNSIALALVVALYFLVAPGVGGGGWSIVWTFVVGQLYVTARGFTKLSAWSSQIVLFQGHLAHAAYVRRPLPAWPESASAEALRVS